MRKYIYFTGAAQNTGSSIFSANYEHLFLFHIYSTGNTSGAYTLIQAQSPAGDWGNVDNRLVSGNGTVLVKYEGPLAQTRAAITGYMNGTFSISVDAI